MQGKIGYCCKTVVPDDKLGIRNVPELNTRSTTITWLKNNPSLAEQRLWELTEHNVNAVKQLVQYVGGLDEQRRMVRLGSDLFSGFTHPDLQHIWRQDALLGMAAKTLAEAGDLARALGVRLSFHPGQHCCIVSDREDVVKNSLEELEYHTLLAKMMGYGRRKLDFKINIHLSGRLGLDGFKSAWNKMSPELRNCLTLENDEYQAGIDDLLPLNSLVGIVLDIHHHLIKTGEYIKPNDDRIFRILESWPDRRPIIHYSQSRQEFIGQFNDRLPSMDEMLSVSSKMKLRSHSDYYDNPFINDWGLSHWVWADIMCESKAKNLAVDRLVTSLK